MKPELTVEEGRTPLDFLKAVYSNNLLPLSVRMRAAVEAAPYVHPKLAVVGTVTSEDFASRLERAVLRSAQAVNNGMQTNKMIEAKPVKSLRRL